MKPTIEVEDRDSIALQEFTAVCLLKREMTFPIKVDKMDQEENQVVGEPKKPA